MADIAVGQPAPDFTLKDENNKDVHLADLRGNAVVLMFYPLDFSPVCTNEMCDVTERFPSFENTGAKVYGISRDSVWTHKAFIRDQNLKLSLLADMKGKVAQQYGAWNDAFGLAERLTVVIDKNGIITFTDRSPGIPTARDQQKMVDALNKTAA
jgi:peroxiredoxin